MRQYSKVMRNNKLKMQGPQSRQATPPICTVSVVGRGQFIQNSLTMYHSDVGML